MKITYTARKVTLRDNFKERVEKKLAKFQKIFSEDAEASVVVTVEKNRQTVEITIRDNGMIYRVENSQAEMNNALDTVTDMLSRQLRKNKTKLSRRLREGSIDDLVVNDGTEPEDAEDDYHLVRRKMVPVKPITVDEAILQMNMIGHKFYMFVNAETNEANVVYQREDGAYGLLEPTIEE